ncbi:DMT family transporter [Aquipuribacter sp. SD81]|uniref:DMT family transporter n=1 Tax=Aquipuribacter sp. SD81 TaxID=3127703 RepID=UPI003018BDA8
MSPTASRPALVLAWFVAASCWGASFLFIKWGLEGLSPAQVALARVLLGSLFLGGWLLVTRTRLPRDRTTWAHLAVLGLFFCFLPFTLFAWAETRIDSGLAAVLNATTPLWTLVLVLAFLPAEKVTTRKVVGLLVGFAGVVVVTLPDLAAGAGGSLLGQLACLGATACYGVALVWVRRFVIPRGVQPLVIAFGQVTCGLGWCLLAAPVLSRDPVDLSWTVVLAMVALGVLGTGLAFVLNTAVTAGLGATFASTVTYLSPVIGVVLGVVVLGEELTVAGVAGGAVVILGVAVGQGLLRLPGRRPDGGPRDARAPAVPATAVATGAAVPPSRGAQPPAGQPDAAAPPPPAGHGAPRARA